MLFLCLSPQRQCRAFLIHYIRGGIILPETNKPVVHLTLMFLQKSKIHCKPDLLVIFSEVANKYYHISFLSFLCFHSASLLPSSKIRCILALDTRLWHTQFPFLLHKRLNPSVSSLFWSMGPPRPSVPIIPCSTKLQCEPASMLELSLLLCLLSARGTFEKVV